MSALLLRSPQIIIPDGYDASTSITQYAASAPQEISAGIGQSIFAQVRCQGVGEAATGNYVFAHAASDGSNGYVLRLRTDTSKVQFFGTTSGGGATLPSLTSSAAFSTGHVQNIGATFDGGILAAGIKLFFSEDAAPIVNDASAGGSDGSGTLTAPVGQLITIGNNSGNTRTFNGDIFVVARWRRILSPAEFEIARLFGPLAVPVGLFFCHANGRDWGPHGLVPTARTALVNGHALSSYVAPLTRYVRRLVTPAASADVSFGLTGQAATVTGGTLTPNIAFAMAGQAATSAGGALVPNVAFVLAGQAVTVAQGTPTCVLGVTLTGQAMTTAGGVILFSILGQSATVVEGTLTPLISYQLLGQAATCQQGVIPFGLIGQAATAVEGVLTPAIAYVLAGQAASAQQGSLGANVARALVGQVATGQQGTLTPGLAYLLAGSSIVVSQGAITGQASGNVTYALIGQQMSVLRGQFTFQFFTVDALRNPLFINTKVSDLTV